MTLYLIWRPFPEYPIYVVVQESGGSDVTPRRDNENTKPRAISNVTTVSEPCVLSFVVV